MRRASRTEIRRRARRGVNPLGCYGTLERVLAPFVRGASVGNVILTQKLIYGIKMYRVKGRYMMI